MKKIALLGKPNVGKSSLFNRIARERNAITSDVSGTTRDIKKEEVSINNKKALLIDTGGLDDSSTLFQAVRDKSLKAAKDSDIILFMVDGKMLPNDEDKKIFFQLQKLNKDIALVVNKMDSDKQKNDIGWEFANIGAKNLFFISVSHNSGTRELINWIDNLLTDEDINEVIVEKDDDEDFFEESNKEKEEDNETFLEDEKEENKEIKIAIIGRVNVGKSSLLNALLKEDRSVVSDVAGTTIDPVNESMEYKDHTFTFVDTAGIRKRGKIEGIEKYALNRTQTMLESADIVLLVLDASEEFNELDERIANLIEKFELGCIIVLNKWDNAKYSYEKSVELVRYKFKFLAYAPIITISALSHKRVHKINDKIVDIYENYSRRVSTSKLNELIKYSNMKHHLPSDQGKLVKIYFATQFDIKPPRIALIMNRPKALHFSYKRYLVNQLRDNFSFEGSPLILEAKAKKSDERRD